MVILFAFLCSGNTKPSICEHHICSPPSATTSLIYPKSPPQHAVKHPSNQHLVADHFSSQYYCNDVQDRYTTCRRKDAGQTNHRKAAATNSISFSVKKRRRATVTSYPKDTTNFVCSTGTSAREPLQMPPKKKILFATSAELG